MQQMLLLPDKNGNLLFVMLGHLDSRSAFDLHHVLSQSSAYLLSLPLIRLCFGHFL